MDGFVKHVEVRGVDDGVVEGVKVVVTVVEEMGENVGEVGGEVGGEVHVDGEDVIEDTEVIVPEESPVELDWELLSEGIVDVHVVEIVLVLDRVISRGVEFAVEMIEVDEVNEVLHELDILLDTEKASLFGDQVNDELDEEKAVFKGELILEIAMEGHRTNEITHESVWNNIRNTIGWKING